MVKTNVPASVGDVQAQLLNLHQRLVSFVRRKRQNEPSKSQTGLIVNHLVTRSFVVRRRPLGRAWFASTLESGGLSIDITITPQLVCFTVHHQQKARVSIGLASS